MGLMSWMRGGDDESGTSSVMGAAMTAIDGIFRPSRLKQRKRLRVSMHRRQLTRARTRH